jgi:hypothetical protein
MADLQQVPIERGRRDAAHGRPSGLRRRRRLDLFDGIDAQDDGRGNDARRPRGRDRVSARGCADPDDHDDHPSDQEQGGQPSIPDHVG